MSISGISGLEAHCVDGFSHIHLVSLKNILGEITSCEVLNEDELKKINSLLEKIEVNVMPEYEEIDNFFVEVIKPKSNFSESFEKYKKIFTNIIKDLFPEELEMATLSEIASRSTDESSNISILRKNYIHFLSKK